MSGASIHIHSTGEVLSYFNANQHKENIWKQTLGAVRLYIRSLRMPPEEIVKYLEEVRGRVAEIEKQAA